MGHPPKTPGAPPTVLICDDEPALRMLVRSALDHANYTVVEARDGDEALEHTRSDHPDIILLDMMMPGRSGGDVLGELRRDPATAEIPVIMLTARAQAADRAAMKLAGANHFLTKPFSPVGLAALVADVLGQADTEQPAGDDYSARVAEDRSHASLERQNTALELESGELKAHQLTMERRADIDRDLLAASVNENTALGLQSDELKAHQLILEREVDINRALLDASVDGIRLVDLEGRTVLANSVIEQLLADVFGIPKGRRCSRARRCPAS